MWCPPYGMSVNPIARSLLPLCLLLDKWKWQLKLEERCMYSWLPISLTIGGARSKAPSFGVTRFRPSGRSDCLPLHSCEVMTLLPWPAQPNFEALVASCGFITEAKDAGAKSENQPWSLEAPNVFRLFACSPLQRLFKLSDYAPFSLVLLIPLGVFFLPNKQGKPHTVLQSILLCENLMY